MLIKYMLKVKVSTPRPPRVHDHVRGSGWRRSSVSALVRRGRALQLPHSASRAPNSRGGLHYSLNARYAPRISSTELRRARPSRAARLEAAKPELPSVLRVPDVPTNQVVN